MDTLGIRYVLQGVVYRPIPHQTRQQQMQKSIIDNHRKKEVKARGRIHDRHRIRCRLYCNLGRSA